MPSDTPTVVVDVVRDWLDYLTVLGTVGAAAVAALAVRQTGRQGRAQQRQLLAARERDIVQRRADFELGILMQLAELVPLAWAMKEPNYGPPRADVTKARGLLLALPESDLPLLRAVVAEPFGDVAARAPLKAFRKNTSGLMTAIDAEIREAILRRRDASA